MQYVVRLKKIYEWITLSTAQFTVLSIIILCLFDLTFVTICYTFVLYTHFIIHFPFMSNTRYAVE